MLALYYWCRNKILGRNFKKKRRIKLARKKYTDITWLNCKYRGVKGFW
jgi:predicted nucleic-acid-binding Zn-ribbon protein